MWRRGRCRCCDNHRHIQLTLIPPSLSLDHHRHQQLNTLYLIPSFWRHRRVLDCVVERRGTVTSFCRLKNCPKLLWFTAVLYYINTTSEWGRREETRFPKKVNHKAIMEGKRYKEGSMKEEERRHILPKYRPKHRRKQRVVTCQWIRIQI